MRKVIKWWRRKRFIHAYRILRNEAERHVAAGHFMTFQAVNEASIDMHCFDCPDLQPFAKRTGHSVWGTGGRDTRFDICNCSVHDITRIGAAHADDCPMAD